MTEAELVLNPRQSKEIVVQVKPSSSREVRFALLSAESVQHDGTLDRSSSWSDANGRARVVVTAPSTPAKLFLRVSTDTAEITAPITVSASGSIAITVQPRYSGPRTVKEWVASVHFYKQCDDLKGSILDGDRVGIGPPDEIEVQDVPMRVPVAVTLRAEQFLSGCTSQEFSLEGPPPLVIVPVNPVPLRLESSVLDVLFGFSADSSAMRSVLERGGSAAALGLRKPDGGMSDNATAANDVAALLDAMQVGLPTLQAQAFASARQSEGWDASIAAALGDAGGSRLTEAFLRWSTIGASALLSPHAFEGRLEGVTSVPGRALITIDLVAGVSATEAGVSAEPMANWEADGSDQFALSGALTWSPSRLSVALATAPAIAETGAPRLEAAMQQLYPCTTVANAMARTSTQNGRAFSTCDLACLQALCGTGMTALLERTRSASGESRERLELTAAGDAAVGSDAQAVALRANWVGRLSSEPESTIGGTLNGWAPRVVAR